MCIGKWHYINEASYKLGLKQGLHTHFFPFSILGSIRRKAVLAFSCDFNLVNFSNKNRLISSEGEHFQLSTQHLRVYSLDLGTGT